MVTLNIYSTSTTGNRCMRSGAKVHKNGINTLARIDCSLLLLVRAHNFSQSDQVRLTFFRTIGYTYSEGEKSPALLPGVFHSQANKKACVTTLDFSSLPSTL